MMQELPTACAGFRHTCSAENARKLAEWIRDRGGVAVWRSVNLSDPSASWSTPAMDMCPNPHTTLRELNNCSVCDGGRFIPHKKPTWQADGEPVIITDPAEIGVSDDVEVKRFHVAVRTGGQGLTIKVSDGGSRRIRSEVEKAGEGAYHWFDYGDYDNAVIMKPKGWRSLAEFMKEEDE